MKNNASKTQNKKGNTTSSKGLLVSEQSVRKLAKLLDETQLTEIEYQVGDHRIRVARNGSGHHFVSPSPQATPTPVSAPLPTDSSSAAAAVESSVGEKVPCPMVGTVYLAAEPGAKPFIKVGDTITKGATLLIIEAMKVMNPIRAPRDGRIVDICVTDANPVEFGEPLVILE